MAIENARKFFDQLMKDKQLLIQFRQLIEMQNEEAIRHLIELGKKNGYSFDTGDIKQMLVEKSIDHNQLSEEEMSAIVGGTIDDNYKLLSDINAVIKKMNEKLSTMDQEATDTDKLHYNN